VFILSVLTPTSGFDREAQGRYRTTVLGSVPNLTDPRPA
jgi:hypothetical protein